MTDAQPDPRDEEISRLADALADELANASYYKAQVEQRRALATELEAALGFKPGESYEPGAIEEAVNRVNKLKEATMQETKLVTSTHIETPPTNQQLSGDNYRNGYVEYLHNIAAAVGAGVPITVLTAAVTLTQDGRYELSYNNFYGNVADIAALTQLRGTLALALVQLDRQIETTFLQRPAAPTPITLVDADETK